MAPSRVACATPWSETVLHVLAHLDVGSNPASCHCPAWIAWARARLGPVEARPLGEDAATLAAALREFDVLANVHGVVVLFATEDDAREAAGKDLLDLRDDEVRWPDALRLARRALPAAEIVRAAAELEIGALASIPPAAPDPSVARALARVSAAAPSLDRFAIALARPLGLRGRVLGEEILVGTPGFGGADAEHVAWQAAHEATVVEIGRRGDRVGYSESERAAIALLRSRARAAGLAEEHARWLGRLDVSMLGPIPDEADGA